MPTPEVFTLRVTVTQADPQGHASNVAFVQWMQEAAVAHSSAAGLTPERYRELGTMFVVRRHEISYLRPAPLGTVLALRTWVADFHGASSRRCYHFLREPDGQEIARATTDWAYLDAKTGRPLRIPADVKKLFPLCAGPFDKA